MINAQNGREIIQVMNGLLILAQMKFTRFLFKDKSVILSSIMSVR